jgi:pimeloyl-ACP methyl ester carboxylesterase
MRALEPVRHGHAIRDGVRLAWELFGEGDATIFLLPTWSIIHSRHWKLQVPYLARHARVLVMDGRGNGRSDAPSGHEAYSDQEFAADALAVMDATETDRAALVSLSNGSRWALLLAAEHPERVAAAVFISPAAPLVPGNPEIEEATLHFLEPRDRYDGWGRSTPDTGCRTTAASWSSSSHRSTRSRTRPSRPRTASPGAWTRPPRPCWTRRSPPWQRDRSTRSRPSSWRSWSAVQCW